MLKNVPSRSSDKGIWGEVTEEGLIHIHTVFNEDCNLTVCYISGDREMIARTIADIIEEARDIGYQHALSDIRNLLGIKE
jgi:hypothetical protein